MARLTLIRLLMDPDIPAKALLRPVMLMLVPRDQSSSTMAPMSTHAVAANGLLKRAAGTMLLLMATVVMPNMVVDTPPPIKVPTLMVIKMLTQLVMVMRMLLDSDTMDPALTLLLRADMAGVPRREDTPMPVLTLMAVPNMVLMAVTGKMPAVMATQHPIPLDIVLANGAPVQRALLMPLLTRMVSRPATVTVAIPKTPTVMSMVLLMPALADTVAPTLMAVDLVLLATLPTLADKVLPCVSVALVETVTPVLVAVAMLANTLELLLIMVRVMVPVAAELLAVVAPALLVTALPAFAETIQMLALTEAEVTHSAVVVVPMATLVAMALATVALVAMPVNPVAMAVLVVMAALTAPEVMVTDTAIMALAATELAEVATAAAMAVAMAALATVALVAMVALVATVAAMAVAMAAVTVATVDTIESCEIKKTTAKRRF